MKLVIDCKEDRLEPEVIALAINLALNPGCAEQLCDYKHGKGLKLLMKRAYKYKDPLIMKVIRNISSHASPDIKNQFIVRKNFDYGKKKGFLIVILLVVCWTTR